MSENNNLPWILANIDMTFNDNQMLQKMIEVFGQVGASVIENTITQNSFIVIKKKFKFYPKHLQHFFSLQKKYS